MAALVCDVCGGKLVMDESSRSYAYVERTER